MKKGRFSLGLLVGAAIGAIAGLLTAPKSGKETRQDIKRKAGDIKQNVEGKIADAKGKVQHVADDISEQVGQQVEHIKEGVEVIKGAEGRNKKE